jgi:hypothetical protein
MSLNEVIGVCCPNNHDMFPRGITRKELGPSFFPLFSWHKCMVVLPLVERQWVYSSDYLKNNPYPRHYNNGCFRLTPQEYAWLGIKCPVCATKSSIFN